MNCLIELHYLPSIAYFASIFHFNEIIIERHEHFVKQSYRNRCVINSANGPVQLIIPLTSKGNQVLITDVRIDYSQKWLNNHWRTIQSSYGKAPFFEHYKDELHRILFKEHTYLYDLNFELLTICLKWLKLEKPVKESLSYEKNTTDCVDLRNRVNAKKSHLRDKYFRAVPYTQVFGSTFVKNTSLVDLIFCQGPESFRILSESARLMNN